MCSNYPEIKLESALGTLEDKIEHLSSYAHVVHTTAKQVISCRRKNEKVFKMSKGEKCTCKACRNTVFHCQICKFVGFLWPSSSWLLELPNVIERMRLKHFSLQCMLNNLENIPQQIIKRFTFHITNKSSFQPSSLLNDLQQQQFITITPL